MSEPMFSCQNETCATEISYPANMLAVWGGEPICERCFEDGDYCPGKRWFELPKFVPEANRQIAALQAERDRLWASIGALRDHLQSMSRICDAALAKETTDEG